MASSTSAETSTNGETSANGDNPAEARPPEDTRGHHLEIFLISFAALLLEISYTRVVSFKLFYYYTYLVIGLALLGIGCGAVLTAISKRLRRATTDTILMVGCLAGAAGVIVGYLIVARISVSSLSIWDYGTKDSMVNFAAIVVICLALFASFIWIGVMISTLFGRKTEGIGKLYFADLVGAGLACAIVVWFISTIGPPRTIALAGAVLAGVGVYVAARIRSRGLPVGVVLTGGLAICVVFSGVLPDVVPDVQKAEVGGADYSAWSPIFRIDTAMLPNGLLLNHDGMLGSVIKPWDGDVDSLDGDPYNFDGDPRAFPFAVLGTPPERVMIIGAAGGHEVLASLHFQADKIDAIELNPLTYKLVTDVYADFDGHLADYPGVNYRTGDGRSYLARSDKSYELIWYPAPDSYSATNAATAGAFVLSESYLYTTETVRESLHHLSKDGILATQFGELDFQNKPNRTTRYVATVRAALEAEGIDDPGRHVVVATSGSGGNSVLSTVLVKREPFTDAEIQAFKDKGTEIEGDTVRYVPGEPQDNSVTNVLTLPKAEQRKYLDSYPYDVDAISDNGPFFWHFARFSDVLRNYTEPIKLGQDREDAIGERVIILLLVLAATLAAVFLLLPFMTMRKVWRAFPRKTTSAVYFAALGFGFMFFEITLIQRLILFLGYPTYSLTVTLASLLVFTGVGALLSARFKGHVDQVTKVMAGVVVLLGLAYLFLLPVLTDALLSSPLVLRVLVTFVVLAPLGIFLGMFMPLGLGAVSGLSSHGEEYVAWGWAVNGFASVIGSVLTTIIAMSFGFNVVLALAVVVYLVALAVLRRLQRPLAAAEPGAGDDAPVLEEPAGNGDDGEVAVGAGPAGAGPVGATTP
jgi:spermidine synthase